MVSGHSVTAGAASATPAFVQEADAHGSAKTSLAVTTGASVTAGDRLVVEVGVWKGSGASTTSVTDTAGDPFVEVTHFTASDGTEMSIWTAPILTGGAKSTITAKPSAASDIGLVALEYSGLSSVADATAVDQVADASGTSGAAGTVSSAATAPTTEGNELAVGFYADSGFGDTLAAGSGFTQRANVSPTANMEMLAEDQPVALGSTPAASAVTGANTVWLMATVVFESSLQATPQAPTNVSASPGNNAVTVTWTAPPSGGSQITSYTVTPFVNGVAQQPTVVAGTPAPTQAVPGGMVNGTAYTFTVTATNANGTGPASAPSSPVTPSAEPQGQWSALQTFPMVAISSILMDNGSFIFWDGWQQPEPTEVWNPSSPSTFTTLNAPDSVFCDGAAQLPDGRIIVVGGYGGLSTGQIGIVDTNIFDPATNTWTRVANMNLPRWYPTLTELANGDYVAISGNSTDSSHWADTPEVYDPTTNTWTLLSKISTSQVHEEEYPLLLPHPQRQRPHDRTVRGRDLRDERRGSDLDARRGAERNPQRFVDSVPPGQDPLQRRGSLGDQHDPVDEHHGGSRHDGGDAGLAADGADALEPDLPHADHAGQRRGSGRRRGGNQQSSRGHQGGSAHRDLESDQRDLVRGGADRRGAELPLDRGVDAQRRGARRRRRPLRRAERQGPGLRPDLLPVVSVQRTTSHDHLHSVLGHLRLDQSRWRRPTPPPSAR